MLGIDDRCLMPLIDEIEIAAIDGQGWEVCNYEHRLHEHDARQQHGGRAGEAVGIRQTVNKATEVIMPLVFGTFSTALGMPPVFWMEALILGWAGVLMRRDAMEKPVSRSAVSG